MKSLSDSWEAYTIMPVVDAVSVVSMAEHMLHECADILV